MASKKIKKKKRQCKKCGELGHNSRSHVKGSVAARKLRQARAA